MKIGKYSSLGGGGGGYQGLISCTCMSLSVIILCGINQYELFFKILNMIPRGFSHVYTLSLIPEDVVRHVVNIFSEYVHEVKEAFSKLPIISGPFFGFDILHIIDNFGHFFLLNYGLCRMYIFYNCSQVRQMKIYVCTLLLLLKYVY